MLARLLEHLPEEATGHSVVCLGPDGPVGDRLRKLKVRVHVLDGRGRFAGPKLMHRTRTIARRLMPEVVLGWMYDGNLAAWWAARGCSARLIWNIRHSIADFHRERRGVRMTVRANAWLSRSPEIIIFNSHAAAAQHAMLGFSADAMTVIPNGFDTNSFTPSPDERRRVRTELRIPDNAFVVGKIARYHPMKDHAGFLNAARRVSEQVPEAHFLLAGRGVDEKNERLKSAIEELDIGSQVHLLGERADVRALNAALDAAVSASAWGEAFSNAVGEALSCGVPVVATDVGDSRLIVGDAGYVVPPGDPEAIAQCLITLYEAGPDRRRSIGRIGRERVQKQYSIERMVERYTDTLTNTRRRLADRGCEEFK